MNEEIEHARLEFESAKVNLHNFVIENAKKKYTVREVLDSLDPRYTDEDNDFDGSIHVVSLIDGDEIEIDIMPILKDSQQQLLERLSDGLDEHQFHEKDCASVYEFIPDGEYQECDCNIERVKALIQEEKERL